MVKVGIIGATGYAGNELVRLLMGHKDVEIMWYGSRSYIDKKYAEVYQNMFEIVEDTCLDDNMEELASKVDVIFTATPQGFLAGVLTEEILSRVKIIDLSADFRIKDVKTYEKWYKIEHKSPQFIEEAVYGLCEINRDKVKGARLIANPGCYTTCSILTAYPLVKEGLIDTTQLVTLSGSKYDETIEAAAGMVISAGYTPSGIAMDPTLSFGLSTMRDTTGRKIYPAVGAAGAAGQRSRAADREGPLLRGRWGAPAGNTGRIRRLGRRCGGRIYRSPAGRKTGPDASAGGQNPDCTGVPGGF